MRYFLIITIATVIFIITACSTGKQLAEQKATASTYFQAENYNDALIAYSQIIQSFENSNNSTACPVYTNAGISALKLGNAELAIDYIKKATYSTFANEDTYFYLAEAYKQVDNLSLEIGALTDYLDKYPEGKEINSVKTRIFYTAVESGNYEKAIGLWYEVEVNNPLSTKLLEAYFRVNNQLNETETCNKIANQLLGLDENNIIALAWFGKKYYREAENLYRKEMKAYEKKKTNKQYRILLKALDAVTVDFKKSLMYFKKLYVIDSSAENANYLSHIYGRLSDKKEEAYYKKLAEQIN